MALNAASEAPRSPGSPERQQQLIVSQPQKIEEILKDLNTITTFEARVSERTGEDRSGSWSGAAGTGTGGKRDDGQVSARDQAIANLPQPEVMRQKVAAQIEDEVKLLQKEVRVAARRASQPGAAYKLTLLYARIRRLNGLLASLAEAAYDVLKRLFVRIIIDRQKAL